MNTPQTDPFGSPFDSAHGTAQGELIDAAEAVIARWETPLWKDVEPTATVIYRLRDAVQKVKASESEEPDLLIAYLEGYHTAKARLTAVTQQRDTLIEELRRIGQSIRNELPDFVLLELDRVETLIEGWNE